MIKNLFSPKEEWDSLDPELIHKMRNLSRKDLQGFYQALRSRFQMVHSRRSIEIFLEFFKNLDQETKDASPFLAIDLNRIFMLIIQYHYYAYIPPLIELMEICGNRELLHALKNILTNNDISRALTHLEVYQIKKTIFTLSNRFSEKDELIYKIEMEIAEADMDWKDDIEI